VPLERVEAVERKPGYIGCTLSHMKCLELALERGYDWVLILEDDCLLKPRARDRFTALLPELWEARDSWDIYSGGPVTVNSQELVNRRSGLFKIRGQSSHFILVHKEACKKILKEISELKELEPIDWFYRHHMRTLTSVPYIATQRPGISSVVIKGDTKEVDHTETFNKTEQKLIAYL
jgi:glycosyl transferase family 25